MTTSLYLNNEKLVSDARSSLSSVGLSLSDFVQRCLWLYLDDKGSFFRTQLFSADTVYCMKNYGVKKNVLHKAN